MAIPTGVVHYLESGDAITHAVAYVLLAMSVASWCFLLMKAWLLFARSGRGRARSPRSGARRRSTRASPRSPAPIASACSCRSPKPRAMRLTTTTCCPGRARRARRTRAARVAARDALAAAPRIRAVLLASIGSTAPFVGLLGTVWGIYHALGSIAASGQAQIENVAGPVGEALIMTAFRIRRRDSRGAGLQHPRRLVRQLAEELDGFARDLHVFVCAQEA